MKTHTTILALAVAGLLAVPVAASAGSVFQATESESGYRIRSAGDDDRTPVWVERGTPRVGDISASGRYVWKDPEKGWISRGHVYALASGRLAHTDECDHQPVAIADAGPLPPLPYYFRERAN